MFGSASDEALIQRALKGSERAWLQLVKRHEERVYNHALRMSGNPDDAMDIMQEVFMSVYRNLGSFRGDSRFTTWLFRIAAFRCTDYFRRRQTRGDVQESTDIEDNDRAPHRMLEAYRDNQDLMALMQNLSGDQRLVVELKYFQHFTFEEIAEQLGISPNTAKTRLYTAIDKLKQTNPVALAG